MRYYMTPWGFSPTKWILALIFASVAFIILFFHVIVKLVIVVVLGVIGFTIGEMIDNKQWMNDLKFRLREFFSR